jgi:hypothetical protein
MRSSTAPCMCCCLPVGAPRNWGRKPDAAKQLRRELLQMEEEVRGGGRCVVVCGGGLTGGLVLVGHMTLTLSLLCPGNADCWVMPLFQL